LRDNFGSLDPLFREPAIRVASLWWPVFCYSVSHQVECHGRECTPRVTSDNRLKYRQVHNERRSAGHIFNNETMSQDNPPRAYLQFTQRYPGLERAWKEINAAGSEGPLDERAKRLVKLAVSIGAMREGAVRSSVRKAVAMGIPREEIEQVVALAAGTLGMPSTVAIFTWCMSVLNAETS